MTLYLRFRSGITSTLQNNTVLQENIFGLLFDSVSSIKQFFPYKDQASCCILLQAVIMTEKIILFLCPK